MNRIDQLFAQKRQHILSLYFCAGHPAAHTTVPIIETLQRKGIDMVEIGIPFSDPLADGEIIQKASTQALQNGMTLTKLFEELHQIRTHITIPLVLMGYLNPIMQYGFERFCQTCQRVGIDGVIIPDLPFADYRAEYKPIADAYGLRMIMLITPETSEERIRLIDEQTEGFIYMVSSAATTGAQSSFGNTTVDYFKRIDAMQLRLPRMIGFGISNQQTLQLAYRNASGAIIGSKFVTLLQQEGSIEAAVSRLLLELQQ